MPVADYLLIWLGNALGVLILVRGLLVGVWRHYPVFCAYLVWTVVRSTALFLLCLSGEPAYASVYWVGEFVGFAFAFCVVFELFRGIFPSSSTLHHAAGWAVIVVLTCVAVVFYFGSERPGNLVIPDVVRKTGTALGVWLVSMLLLARYYGQRMGRNVLGIAAGVGVATSVSVINLAAFGITASFYPIMRYLSPATAIAVYLLWTWALWYYVPGPGAGSGDKGALVHGALLDWEKSWRRVELLLRKVFER